MQTRKSDLTSLQKGWRKIFNICYMIFHKEFFVWELELGRTPIALDATAAIPARVLRVICRSAASLCFAFFSIACSSALF